MLAQTTVRLIKAIFGDRTRISRPVLAHGDCKAGGRSRGSHIEGQPRATGARGTPTRTRPDRHERHRTTCRQQRTLPHMYMSK